MANNILFKRSNVLNGDGSIKLPSSSSVDYGEICVNYKNNHEVISIKNSSSEIKTFSSDKDIDTLDSAPTETTSMSSYGIPYNIGDKVRVIDSIEKNGYKLYKLIDKQSDDKMVWEMTYSEENKPYYFIIDQTVQDPYKMISSAITDNSREAIEWIRNNSHRYLGSYVSGDDMMYLCQLDDNDSTKFYDGTKATLTGGHGDVFMKLPKFYYKAENTSGNNWKIGFSMGKVDSTWKCWEGNDLIGAFEAIYTDSKLRSIKSNSYSTIYISWDNFITYARSRYGNNHGKLVTWEQHCMMAFLYYAYYLNTNSQLQCGSGYNSTNKACGQQLSMIDTTSANGNSTKGINFWGLENWWGNNYEWIDNASGGSNVFTITTYDGTTGAFGSNRTTTAYNVKGNFARMTVGEYLDASALDSTKASDSTGYCDWFQNGGSSCIVSRSNYNSLAYGGVSFAYAIVPPSANDSFLGSRLSYVGPWTLLTSNEYLNKIYSIGAFIQDIDGNLYTTDEWDGTKTPNGIAVCTKKVRVLLALTEASSTMPMSSGYYDHLEDYTTGTTVESEARVDYNGKTNTENIMKLQPSTDYAAGWCNAFTFPDGKTKGYLPAFGEWYEISKYNSEVDAALKACGGTALKTDDSYWSSTFWGVDNQDLRRCWVKHLFYSGGAYDRLLDYTYVRAIASLD